jgi:outer membrane receptor protein involved in Fe transport
VHEATGAFEIGDPNLTIESADSIEVGLRRRGPFRFEATAFHTRFKSFIFRRFTGLVCAEDFNSCGDPAVAPDYEFRQIVYSQCDASFTGAEVQAQLDVAPLAGSTVGSTASSISCARASTTAPTCRASRRCGSAAASTRLARRQLLHPHRPAARLRAERHRGVRDAERGLQSAQG